MSCCLRVGGGGGKGLTLKTLSWTMDDIKCKSIFKEEIKDFEIMVKEMIGGL